MISTSRDQQGFQAKKEGDTNDNKFPKIPSSSTSSRQWSGFRNPRIVRVSRSFGGKDRHSKVCTIRGLRDRRIRLSVPTAIQLYDLQDRLGLNQPSKVIDWLLDVTKDDIDKLPPLPIPPGFGQFHSQMLANSHDQSSSYATQSSLAPNFFNQNSSLFTKDGLGFQSSLFSNKEGIKINDTIDHGEDDHHRHEMAKSKFWDVDAPSLRAKGKGFERDINVSLEKGKWVRADHEDEKYQDQDQAASAQKFFPVTNHSSIQGMLNSSAMPFNNYYHWEPSNLSLSQFGSQEFQSQTENSNNNNTTISLQPSLALPSGSHHMFFCPPPPITTQPSLFPSYSPYVTNSTNPSDHQSQDYPRHINHFQLLSSSSSQNKNNNILPNSLTITPQVKPFPFNVHHGLAHHSHTINNAQSHHKDEEK